MYCLSAISCEGGGDSFHVENAEELPLEKFADKETVAMVAGASTPDWIIQELAKTLEEL